MKATLRSTAMAALCVGTLALTACGGNASAGPEGGDSVKIMVFGSMSQAPFVLPQIETGAQAAVEHVNKAGGINGTKIELISCDDQMNANAATACGRQAVDEGVAAVVGTFSLFSDNVLEQITAEGIPLIQSEAMNQGELSQENSFPVLAAVAPNFAALLGLKERGCTDFVVAAPQSATSEYAFGLVEPVAKTVGVEAKAVLYPANTTDFTSVAAQLVDKSDCVLLGGGSAESVATLTALKQTGTKTTNVALSTIAFPNSTIDELGDTADGTLVYSPLFFESTGKEAVSTAVEEIQAIKSDTVIDEMTMNAYSSVITFAEAAKTIDGDITGQAVTDALNSDLTIDNGFTAPFNFSTDTEQIPNNPRVVGTKFIEYEVKGGDWQPTGKEFDLAGNLD